MQPTDLAMALTHGQMAKALRLGEVAGLEQDRVADGRPPVAADPARAHVRRLGATITAGMLVAGALTAARATENPHEPRESGRSAASGAAARGSIPRPAAAAPGRDRAHASAARANQVQAAAPSQEQSKMLSKFTGVAAATAVGVSATVAGAQSAAVQWRVEDGGNGHWYQSVASSGSWTASESNAEKKGGHLVTINSSAESSWINYQRQHTWLTWGSWCWYGGKLNCGTVTSPNCVDCHWEWANGEAFDYTNWAPGEPNCGYFTERVGSLGTDWADLLDSYPVPNAIVEWSADCNNDGIVDYGQILDGTFTDANSNGIPDSCDCLGDINDDGWIDGVDLGGVLAAWGKAPAGTPADLNADGAVDGTDLGLLLSGWGPCGQ